MTVAASRVVVSKVEEYVKARKRKTREQVEAENQRTQARIEEANRQNHAEKEKAGTPEGYDQSTLVPRMKVKV